MKTYLKKPKLMSQLGNKTDLGSDLKGWKEIQAEFSRMRI
jgi:hypothetical protein